MQGGKAGKHVDETACGPLCQHPLCWASNRRVERGLPRVVESAKRNSEISLKDDLPTLKVVDLFGGESVLPVTRHNGRSLSAPLLANTLRETTKAPLTPTASPAVTAALLKGKKHAFTPPALKKIEVHEIVEWPENWSDNFIGSHFYLWCSTKNASRGAGQADTKFIQSTGCLSSTHPEHVRIKDVTEDMLPSSVQKQKQKKKKHGSHKTPTGGRPYTNPSKGNLPRSYLKSPREDEISQLLSLPKEVLLQVIEHANNSDIYDKDRVHKLLEKVLPQIHFQQHILEQQKQLAKKRNTARTPLEESGILQNKKVQLKEGPKLASDQAVPIQSKPFILDNSVGQENAENNATVRDEKKEEEDKAERVVEKNLHERITESEEIKTKPQKKTLAPLKGVKPDGARSLTKLTSVSTRTLSPLHSGISPTKPFNYSAKLLDWTLGPLPIKEKKVVLKPVTPTTSEKASTLHVTIPSVMSPDRMSLVASVTPRDRSPYPPSRTKSPYRQSPSMNSSLAAEENPIHAISPSLSTNVPLAPLGTPAPVQKQASFNVDSTSSKPSTANTYGDQGSGPTTPVNTPFHADQQQPAPILGTIQERRSEATSVVGSAIIPSDRLQSPAPLSVNNRSRNDMSPWEEFNSTAVQPSEKMNPSPVPVVTPALTGMTTPDHWPAIDEHEYLHSPAEKLAEEILAPAAPPPSPEPVEMEHESDERLDVPKSVVTTSLTPLQEEEEEEEDIIVNENIKGENGKEADTETNSKNVSFVTDNEPCAQAKDLSNHVDNDVDDSNQ